MDTFWPIYLWKNISGENILNSIKLSLQFEKERCSVNLWNYVIPQSVWYYFSHKVRSSLCIIPSRRGIQDGADRWRLAKSLSHFFTGHILVWLGIITLYDLTLLMRTMKTASKILGSSLPQLWDIYMTHCMRKALCVMKDTNHPAHSLLAYLLSGKRTLSFRAQTSRFRDGFYSQANRSTKWL